MFFSWKNINSILCRVYRFCDNFQCSSGIKNANENCKVHHTCDLLYTHSHTPHMWSTVHTQPYTTYVIYCTHTAIHHTCDLLYTHIHAPHMWSTVHTHPCTTHVIYCTHTSMHHTCDILYTHIHAPHMWSTVLMKFHCIASALPLYYQSVASLFPVYCQSISRLLPDLTTDW